jgi:uncharacterized protein YcgL (UPF0745 family)
MFESNLAQNFFNYNKRHVICHIFKKSKKDQTSFFNCDKRNVIFHVFKK